ncbi:MAG: glycoside hydrolase family 38 [Opitutaceae bacterium]
MPAPERAPRVVLHLVANSHLDPVWLWDFREGLTEAVNTVRTVLTLLRERPELRYIRGETLVYEEIRRRAPAAFREIRRLVRAGRWDPVGGTYLQPDMNLPAAETLHRHFREGQAFLRRHFGRPAWAGWSADCFGHTPFLPDILRAHGLRAYAFGRPRPADGHTLCWWESPTGTRVLAVSYAVGWYGCERDELPARLDACLAAAPRQPVPHLFVPYGLGNHGGGPTRRHLDDAAAWAAQHPECEVRHSTLHGYFAAVEQELRARRVALPVVRDLGHCLRGTYASALRVKTAYRRTEAAVIRLERLLAMLPPAARQEFAPRLGELWRAVLRNSFHDILPGTAIPRALDEQVEELGGALHGCRELERDVLLALAPSARRVPPRPVPADHPRAVTLLVANPHGRAYRGLLELEAMLDFRPVWGYAGRPAAVPLEVRGPGGRRLRFQELTPGHNFMPHLPWRKRVVLAVTLPPRSRGEFTLGWVEGARPLPPARVAAARARGRHGIGNGLLRLTAVPGRPGGARGAGGRPLLGPGGLQALLVDDPYGPWGGHYEEPASLDLHRVRQRWRITAARVTEDGPIRASLWCRLAGTRSDLELTFRLGAGAAHVTVESRVFFAERRARLKLALPGGDTADFALPGGVLRRGPAGEVPGGRWLRVLDARGRPRFLFASDALYGFCARDGCCCATVVRSTRQTMARPERAAALPPEEPVLDRGEFRFRFLLGRADPATLAAARQFEEPPLVLPLPTPA